MNISTPSAIANEIKSRETCIKFFHDREGKRIIISIVKNKVMYVKHENSKGWYDCTEYDKKGNCVTDWVDKNPEELKLLEVQKGV